MLKPLFDRTLGGALAYPSGHTAALTALAIVAALLLVSLLRVGDGLDRGAGRRWPRSAPGWRWP